MFEAYYKSPIGNLRITSNESDIIKIEFSDDESYEGFWEKRGYSNGGNLGERFYD
jgi:hypothetical protein